MPTRKWGSQGTIEVASGFTGRPAFAALADGGFILSWSLVTDLTPTADGDVYMQRYDAFGAAETNPALVNTTVTGAQAISQVSGLSDGGWVVTWQDASATGGDTSGSAVRGQRYTATGAPAGGEFRANTSTGGDQFAIASTGLRDGGFVVAFTNDGDPEVFDDPESVRFQRYGANGTAAGGEIQVNTGVTSASTPSIAGLADGGFVVTWAESEGSDIRGRRYDALGNALGVEFTVNTTVDGRQFQPEVTALLGGGFVVTWFDPSAGGSVFAQVFDAAGEKLGSEFLANATTIGGQVAPDICALNDGGFFIVYSDTSRGNPATEARVLGQAFDASGNRVGAEIMINTATDGANLEAEVRALADGRVVVGWSTLTFTDGVASGISSSYQIIDPRDGIVTGTANGELLLGHDAVDDEINGYNGADTLRGLKGDDQLYGGGGDDIAYGGRDDDDAWGGAGADRLWGDAGDDTLTGEAGDDELRGGDGLDTMVGGTGSDSYFVDQSGDSVTERAGAANGTADTIFSTISIVNVANVERVFLAGSSNANASGLSTQADQLNGSLGNNILNGFGGNDRLSGKAGDDTFRFTTALNAATNLDTITDFVAPDDTIQLENAVFAGLAAGALAASAFKIVAGPGAAAVDANDRILYNATTGALFFDSNGSGAGGSTQFATLTGAPTISAADFFVI